MGLSESKIAFKQTTLKLTHTHTFDPEDPIWDELFTLPETAEDVMSFWGASDIQELLRTKPQDARQPAGRVEQVEPKINLITFVYKTIARLDALQNTHLFPDDPAMTSRQIVNCMRFLTRLMPFLYQADQSKEWYNTFFWEPQKPTYLISNGGVRRSGQLFDGLNPSKKYGEEDANTPIGPPLGERMVDLAMRYLFFPGYTLPRRLTDDGLPDLEIRPKVWHTGIGCTTSPRCTPENLTYQYETLRFLLTLTSNTMYLRPDEVALADNKPLTFMTTRMEKRFLNAMTCSLLNTVLRFQPASWTLPTGMVGARDTKKLLVMNCLQYLLVLMVYVPPSTAVGQGKNLLRSGMGALYRPDDFQFIHSGIKLILDQPILAFRSFIPKNDIAPWAPEMMSFLWELTQCNKKFRRYLCETKISLDYMVTMLYYIMDGANDDPKHEKTGVTRLCALILQSFSTDLAFCYKMNTPFLYVDHLPDKMRLEHFKGSYGDYLFRVIFLAIMNDDGHLRSVYGSLLDTIKNIAPFQVDLTKGTCTQMLKLFERMSKPDFFLADNGNSAALRSLLAACNAIMGKKLQGNPRFVRILIASKDRFKALRDLTIDGALAELDRKALERKDRGDVASLQNSSRADAIDAMRPAAALRSSHPRNVPENERIEDDRFAIGDDDDVADEGPDEDGRVTSSTVLPGSTEAAADNGPPARLSEKARGKQKQSAVVSVTTSSRTASTNSLTTLTSPTNASQLFQPSEQWLEGYIANSPLDSILAIIEDAERRLQDAAASSARTSTASQRPQDADLSNAPREKQSAEHGREARQSAQLSRQSDQQHNGTQTPYGPDGQGYLESESTYCVSRGSTLCSHADAMKGDLPPAGWPAAFQWTAVAVGWYSALIWSRIYLQETEAYQGPNGLYSSTDIKLFRRHAAREEVSLRNPKGAIDAVGNSLAQRISNMSISK